jgi:hypothetical protein
MSMTLLAAVVLALTAAVVVAIFLVLWRERTSASHGFRSPAE